MESWHYALSDQKIGFDISDMKYATSLKYDLFPLINLGLPKEALIKTLIYSNNSHILQKNNSNNFQWSIFDHFADLRVAVLLFFTVFYCFYCFLLFFLNFGRFYPVSRPRSMYKFVNASKENTCTRFFSSPL